MGQIPSRLMPPMTKKIRTVISQLPSIIVEPAQVEENTVGTRAKVAIAKT